MNTPESTTAEDRRRREFVANKMRLYDAMVRDPKLSRMDLAVSWVLLSSYLNFETMTAWPSAARIAADLKVAERSVWRSIEKLIERGWWKVRLGERGRRGGRGRSNEYEPVWQRAPKTLTSSSENPDDPVRETLTSSSENPDENVTRIPSKNPGREPRKGTRGNPGASGPRDRARQTKVARHGERDGKSEPRQRELPVMANVLNRSRRTRNDAEQDLGNDLVRMGLDAEDVLRGGFDDVYKRAIEIEYGRPGYGVRYVMGACAKAGAAA